MIENKIVLIVNIMLSGMLNLSILITVFTNLTFGAGSVIIFSVVIFIFNILVLINNYKLTEEK